jgi:hypothetical protein
VSEKRRRQKELKIAGHASMLLLMTTPEDVAAHIVAQEMLRSPNPHSVAAEALRTEDPKIVLWAIDQFTRESTSKH